jgi:hypothetical protein
MSTLSFPLPASRNRIELGYDMSASGMAVPSLITHAFLVAIVRLVILHWYYHLALELPGCGRSVVTLVQAEGLMRARRSGIAERHDHARGAALLPHCGMASLLWFAGARGTAVDVAGRIQRSNDINSNYSQGELKSAQCHSTTILERQSQQSGPERWQTGSTDVAKDVQVVRSYA